MKILLSAAVAAMMAAGSAQAAYISRYIDTFDNAVSPLFADQVDTSFGTSSPDGYNRYVSAFASGDFTIVSSGGGVYSHSQTDGVTALSYIRYDFGAPLDLTDDPLTASTNDYNAFRILVDSVDISGGGLGISIDGINYWGVKPVSGDADGHYFDILFSDILSGDITSVSSLYLVINGTDTPSLDLSIAEFGLVCSAEQTGDVGTMPGIGNGCAVPEPTSPALVGLGLLGLGLMRRRLGKQG